MLNGIGTTLKYLGMPRLLISALPLFFLSFIFTPVSAQSDLQLVKGTIENQSAHDHHWHEGNFNRTANPIKLVANAALWIYQKEITYQLFSNCMYSTSCSEFSRQSFGQFGAVKGLLLTLDRLARCNQYEARYIQLDRLETGKYDDPVERYRFR